MTSRMTMYTHNSTVTKKYVKPRTGHRKNRAEMRCNRPGTTDNTANTKSKPPNVRHKKTPIFQSNKGHSRLNHTHHEGGVVMGSGGKCECTRSANPSNSDDEITPSRFVSKCRNKKSEKGMVLLLPMMLLLLVVGAWRSCWNQADAEEDRERLLSNLGQTKSRACLERDATNAAESLRKRCSWWEKDIAAICSLRNFNE